MTYTVTLIPTFPFGSFFKTKIKNVKGHVFPNDIPKNIMLIILEDERRIFVNIDNYNIELSKENYVMIQERIAAESKQPLPTLLKG